MKSEKQWSKTDEHRCQFLEKINKGVNPQPNWQRRQCQKWTGVSTESTDLKGTWTRVWTGDRSVGLASVLSNWTHTDRKDNKRMPTNTTR